MSESAHALKISVVIPVFQAEQFLTQCLDSVLGQTLQEFEVICIDDGSTDRSAEMLDQFSCKDDRIRIIHQKNQGAGASRNLGLKCARGEYIIFLDSDDYFGPTLLAELYGAIETEHGDVCICRSVSFDNTSGEYLPSEWMRKDYFLKGKTVFHPREFAGCIFQFTYGWAWDKLFRTEFLRAGGFSFPMLKNSEDLVFVYPAIAVAERIVIINQKLVYYRMNRQASVSHTRENAPTEVWLGMQMLEAELKKYSVYSVFEQSFLNWTLEFLVWNVSNMSFGNSQCKEFYRVKQELLPYYALHLHTCDYYHNKMQYLKYLLMRFSTYSIYCHILRFYRRLKP